MSAPTVSSVTFNDATDTLTITGANLPSSYSLNAADFLITGTGGSTLSLSLGSNASYKVLTHSQVNATDTALTITFTGNIYDMVLPLESLLNNNGTQAQDGTSYNLELQAGWITGATSTVNLPITVVNVPAPVITGASYDAVDGELTLNSTGIMNTTLEASAAYLSPYLSHFSLDGIALSGATAGNFNLKVVDSGQSAGLFTLTLNGTEKAEVNAALAANGNLAFAVTPYWYLGSGDGYSLNATNANIIVSEEQALQTGAGAQGYVDQPVQLAVSGSTLYIADALNQTVDEVSTAGGPVDAVVSAGAGYPYGVAVDASGNLYLADYVGGRILELAHGSSTLAAIQTSGLTGPYALAVDSFGNLYVADSWDGRIEKIAAGTHQTSTVVSGLNFPDGLAVDGFGNIYFTSTDSDSVMELVAGSQAPVTLAAGLNAPQGLAVDGFGNVYVANTDANNIVEIAANTHLSYVLPAFNVQVAVAASNYSADVNLSQPTGITVDSAGNLYVSEDLSPINGGISNAVLELAHQTYQLTAAPAALTAPVLVDNLWENTQQIQLAKAEYTAFTSGSTLSAANFSNAAAPTSTTDYLYYDHATGGLYYDAYGSYNPGAAVEIAVIGSDTHPGQLTVGDFKLI